MKQVDAVVVGAGFAGLYMLHKLRGLGFSVQGFETGGDVGGTWYWNRYPGARCDVESMDYSYSFDGALEQEWDWTERYATQPEILAYLGHVADRFDLRPLIAFDTRVEGAEWRATDDRWTVTAPGRETLDARFVVMATGSLSQGKAPDIAGLRDFGGDTYFTGEWPHDGVDFTGKRVGIIGTGSSAIQAIPMIAADAKHLTVFQRTASFTIPSRNRPLAADEVAERKSRYPDYRREVRMTRLGVPFRSTGKTAFELDDAARSEAYEAAWQVGGAGFGSVFIDTIVDERANAAAADFVRAKIAATVTDPETAEALTPRAFPIGSKRLAVDTDYWATFNRDNVTLVNLRKTPLVRVTESGVETTAGEVALDALVLATGFDAMTGSFLKVALKGEGGITLAEKWAAGPRTYLGLMSAGFPNCFFIAGPGSPSVLSNMVVSIEQHVDWVADCVTAMRDAGQTRIEAEADAEDAWVNRINTVAATTLFMKGDSWYLGANVPGKPRVFMPFIGGVGTYREIADEVARDGYRGFTLARTMFNR